MVSESQAREAVREFIGRVLRVPELDGDEDIFASGLANSLFAMQLVQYVELEFGITVESEDLDIENFKTVNSLARFVCTKQAVGRAA